MKNELDTSWDQMRDDPFERIGSLIGKSPRTWQSVGAVFGLAGGLLAPALGTLLTVMSWFVSQQRASLYLSRLSTILFFLTIPLLALGAHCLDMLEARATTPSSSAATPFGGGSPVGAGARAVLRGGGRHVHKGGVAPALLLLVALPIVSRAQQTVFNVPTTDVLDKGKGYFELDVSAKPNDDEALSKFSSFVPRLVVGVGHNVEVGLNVLGNVQPGPDATTLVPTVKWRFYNGGDNGWAMVAGAHLHVPVRNKAYNVGNYSYVMTRKSFKSGTRVGFGGYFFSKDVVAASANRAGGQFTFEQPITKKLNWNADWFTGKHAAGYFTTGAAYKLSKKLTGVAAYSIGNQNPSKGNHFFYFELGYNFN